MTNELPPKTVFLAEDDDNMRTIIRMALERDGYEVLNT